MQAAEGWEERVMNLTWVGTGGVCIRFQIMNRSFLAGAGLRKAYIAKAIMYVAMFKSLYLGGSRTLESP